MYFLFSLCWHSFTYFSENMWTRFDMTMPYAKRKEDIFYLWLILLKLLLWTTSFVTATPFLWKQIIIIIIKMVKNRRKQKVCNGILSGLPHWHFPSLEILSFVNVITVEITSAGLGTHHKAASGDWFIAGRHSTSAILPDLAPVITRCQANTSHSVSLGKTCRY